MDDGGTSHHSQRTADGWLTVHSLQLWVNLPAADKMVEPRTQNLVAADLPLRRERSAEIRIFSGKSGDLIAPTKNYTPVIMLEVRLEAGARSRQEVDAAYSAFLVLKGDCSIGKDQSPVHDGDLVWLTRKDDEGVFRSKQPWRSCAFCSLGATRFASR